MKVAIADATIERRDLSGYDKVLLAVMISVARGGRVWGYTYEEFAFLGGMGLRTAYRSMANLRRAGCISTSKSAPIIYKISRSVMP